MTLNGVMDGNRRPLVKVHVLKICTDGTFPKNQLEICECGQQHTTKLILDRCPLTKFEGVLRVQDDVLNYSFIHSFIHSFIFVY